MINRICGECGSHKVVDAGSYAGSSFFTCETCGQMGMCEKFPEMTVFDRITASPEVLAKSSVYCLSSDLCRSNEGKFTVKSNWKSPFIDRCYDTEAKAIAATLVRLKEVEK